MKQGIIFSGLVIGLCLVFTMGCSSPGDGGGEPVVALDEDFEDGGGFWLAKGFEDNGVDPVILDNNQIASIGGQTCIRAHAYAEEKVGDPSIGVEVQFDLGAAAPYDMSGEDFIISFDVYVPQASIDEGMQGFQFAFYETVGWTPIYSKWWVDSITDHGDEWVHIVGYIDTTSGDITYSGFPDAGGTDPDDWQFHVVRFQFVTDEADDDILFYLDNIVVERP